MVAIDTVDAVPARRELALQDHPEFDPFGFDHPDDVPIVTSERRLQRLAISAADAGARFVRESVPHDPAAWMLAPVRMFEFARPIEACQDLDGFTRASLLHGLHIGLDATPEELDALVGEADLPDEFEVTRCDWAGNEARLFTAVIRGELGVGSQGVLAFCAMMAESADMIRARLRTRYGPELLETAEVIEGYEESPVGDLLLSPRMKTILIEVAADPKCPRAHGLEVQLDTRGAA